MNRLVTPHDWNDEGNEIIAKHSFSPVPFWCRPYAEGNSTTEINIDHLLEEVNQATLRAVEHLLPQNEYEFHALAVPHAERGGITNLSTAKRLQRTLATPIREILNRGGKGWRSYTIAACCTAVGGDFYRHMHWLAMPEIMHVGSLIIDDIEDGSSMRRGGTACHLLHGQATAINAGNYAYFAVQPLFENFQGSCSTLNALYREYVALLRVAHAGQALDIEGIDAGHIFSSQILENHINEIHRLKSGMAFRASARFGVILGEGSSEQCETLGEFMARVGTAFQIIDDILNIKGFASQQKNQYEDIIAGKITYPICIAFDRLSRHDKEKLLAALNIANQSPDAVSQVIRTLEETQAIEISRQKVCKMLNDAQNLVIDVIPDSPARRYLFKFSQRMIERFY